MELEDKSFPMVAAKGKETEQVKLEAEDTPVPPEAKSLSVLAAKGNIAATAPRNTVHVVPTRGNLYQTGPFASKAGVIAVLGSDPPYAESQFEDVGMKHGYRKRRYCGCAVM